VACDVGRDVELTVDPDWTLCPRVGRVLRSWLGPARRRVPFPGLAAVVLRSVECREAATKAAGRSAAALYLAPPVEAFGLAAATALPAIVDAGYRYALERLRERPAPLSAREASPPAGR